MKRIAIAVGVAVLVFGVAILAQQKSGSAEQELIKLEKDWSDAYVKHDWAFLDRIVSDDYIFTDPDGKIWTKAQWLANLKSGEVIYTSVVTDNIKVRLYGDAAVVIGRNMEKSQNKARIPVVNTNGRIRGSSRLDIGAAWPHTLRR
jgi:hypothetical protein